MCRIALLAFSIGTLLSVPAQAAIQVAIHRPGQDEPVFQDQLDISVGVTSTWSISSVKAHVGPVDLDLTYSYEWTGSVDMRPFPFGRYECRVDVVDSHGNTGSGLVTFLADRKPDVRFSGATNNDFVTTLAPIPVHAACIDDDPTGCMSITLTGPPPHVDGGVSGQPPVVTSGKDSVDGTLFFGAEDEGQIRSLAARATDTSKQVVGYAFLTIADTRSGLTKADHVDGTILDWDCGRILFSTATGLFMRDRAKGTDVQVGNWPFVPRDGWYQGSTLGSYLTPKGAIFVSQYTGATFEYKDGASRQIDQNSLGPWKIVNGRALLQNGSGDDCTLLDIESGARSIVPCKWRNNGGLPAYLLSNGELYYQAYATVGDVTRPQWYRFANGQASPFSVPGCGGPLTADEDSVLLACGANVFRYAGGPLTDLGPAAGDRYLVVGDMLAYERATGGATQIFVRGADHVEHQLSDFGASSKLESLDRSGAVTFIVSVDGTPRRFVGRPGADAVEVFGTLGTPRWQHGQLELGVLGRIGTYGQTSDGTMTCAAPAGSGADAAVAPDAATVLDAGAPDDAVPDAPTSVDAQASGPDAAAGDAPTADASDAPVVLAQDGSAGAPDLLTPTPDGAVDAGVAVDASLASSTDSGIPGTPAADAAGAPPDDSGGCTLVGRARQGHMWSSLLAAIVLVAMRVRVRRDRAPSREAAAPRSLARGRRTPLPGCR